MLVLKNALVTLSLGAALVVPNAALASKTAANCNHPVASAQHAVKHDSDNKSKKVESKDKDKKVETKDHDKKVESKDHDKKVDSEDHDKKVESKDHDKKVEAKDHDKKVESKDDTRKQDKDDHTKKVEKADKDDDDDKSKPVTTPVAGKGNAATGQVLAATVAPATVKAASTLPVTGAGTDIALAAAVASAFAAYQLAKRRARV